MKVNGKDFKELVLWQKILALIAVPVILLTTIAGIAGILAITFSFVAVIVIVALIVAVPIAIFKKIRGSVIKHEK